jgi:long-chain fatty acid transport protein
VYYNPAGLGFAQEPSVSLGFQYGDLNLEINGERRAVPTAPALTIGFGLPLNLGGLMKDRLSLGLGFVLPQTSVLLARTPMPQTPHMPLLEYRAQTISIQGGLALRVTDWLSVGAGFIALSGLEGNVVAEPNASGVLGAEVEDALIASYAPIFGGLIRGPIGLSVATVYRGESKADYSLPITADLGESFPLVIPVLELHGTAQYDPQQWTAEISWQHAPFTLSAAATFKRWSEFPIPIHYPAVPDGWPTQPDPSFEDVWLLRFGASFTHNISLGAVVFRGGYIFEPSPLPEDQDFHNYLDNDRHVLTTGVGFTWDVFSLNVVAQWHHLVTESRDSAPFSNLQDEVLPQTLMSSGSLWFLGSEVQLGF